MNQKPPDRDENELTQTYGETETRTPTETYGVEQIHSATENYGTDNIEKPLTEIGLHGVTVDGQITLKNKFFTVESVISTTATAEAVVYLIADERKKRFALKLYRQFESEDREPNPEALARIAKIHDKDILKLVDYGIGSDKYLGKYCYEISPFAEGGTLAQICSIPEMDVLINTIIRQIFNGIKTLHANQIIHCDLKPENIYFLDKARTDLVIGDYGTAKTFGFEDKKVIQAMSMVMGTKQYLAPEQQRGLVSPAGDYHALGMIVLALLYPDKRSQRDFNQILERQNSRKEIIDFDPKYEHLNNLISGLTLEDRELRWGKEQVERWFKGENVPVEFFRVVSKGRILKFGEASLQSLEELAQAMNSRRDWYETLFRNEMTYKSLFYPWLSEVRNIEFAQMLDNLKEYYTKFGESYVKFFLWQFFTHSKALRVGEKTFEVSEGVSLSAFVHSAIDQFDQIGDFSASSITFFIFRLEYFIRIAIATGNETEGKRMLNILKDQFTNIVIMESDLHRCSIFEQYDAVSLIKLIYALNPKRVFRTKEGTEISDYKQIALYAAKGDNYSDRRVRTEIECYFRANKREFQLKKTIAEFLVACFEDEVSYLYEVKMIRQRRPFEYEVHYNITFNLTALLDKYKIVNPNLVSAIRSNTVNVRRGILDTNLTFRMEILRQIRKANPTRSGKLEPENKVFIREELGKIGSGKTDYREFQHIKPLNKVLIFTILLLIAGYFFLPLLLKQFLPVVPLALLCLAALVRKFYYWARVTESEGWRRLAWWVAFILFISGMSGIYRNGMTAYYAADYRRADAIATLYDKGDYAIESSTAPFPFGELSFTGMMLGADQARNRIFISHKKKTLLLGSAAKLFRYIPADSTLTGVMKHRIDFVPDSEIYGVEREFNLATKINPGVALPEKLNSAVQFSCSFKYNAPGAVSGFVISYCNTAVVFGQDFLEVRELEAPSDAFETRRYYLMNAQKYGKIKYNNNKFVPTAELESKMANDLSSNEKVLRYQTIYHKAFNPSVKKQYLQILFTRNLCIVKLGGVTHNVRFNQSRSNLPQILNLQIKPNSVVEISAPVLATAAKKPKLPKAVLKNRTFTTTTSDAVMSNQLVLPLFTDYNANPRKVTLDELSKPRWQQVQRLLYPIHQKYLKWTARKHQLPANTRIEILGQRKGFYLVRYRKKIGYIPVSSVAER